MEDLYVECLVPRKPRTTDMVIRGIAYGATAVFFLMTVWSFLFLILFGIMLAVDLLLLPRLSLEYEYLYVSRTLQIDRIFSKQSRKKAVEYDLEKMEIFAEEGAWQLDEYKNLNTVTRDFTSGDAGRTRWIMIAHDGPKVDRAVLEPSEELISAIKGVYPRKTFTKS